jgi:hypothetical protein
MRTGSYITWDAERTQTRTTADVFAAIVKHQHDAKRVFVVVPDRDFHTWRDKLSTIGVAAGAHFGGPVEASDTYAVFLLGPTNAAPTRGRSR